MGNDLPKFLDEGNARCLYLDLSREDDYNVFRYSPEDLLSAWVEDENLNYVVINSLKRCLDHIPFGECFLLADRYAELFTGVGRICLLCEENKFSENFRLFSGNRTGYIRVFNEMSQAVNWLSGKIN